MKKVIAAFLAILLCISLCVPVFAAEEPSEIGRFTFGDDKEPVQAELLHSDDAGEPADDGTFNPLPVIIAVVAGVAVIAVVAVVLAKKKK